MLGSLANTTTVDEQTRCRTSETHDGTRTHGLVILLRVDEFRVQTALTDSARDHPAVVLTDTRQQVIADETVQRVLAVFQHTVRAIMLIAWGIVIETGIIRIGLVVDVLGIGNQLVDGVDAITLEHRVGLDKGRVLEIALAHPEGAGVGLTTTGTTLHRASIYRVVAAGIALVEVSHQRVAHTRQLQGLREE